MADRSTLRLAATLLLVGEVVFVISGIFHPDRQAANDHNAAFAEYAASSYWTLIHLGQFAGMAIIVTGFLVLSFALNVQSGVAGWANGGGAISAIVALALYGVLQAVDGVALKQTVDAWVNAPDAEKAARFASAETIRWLEWGVRSYQSFMFGLALISFGSALALTAIVPRPIGYLMGLSGLAYIVQGYVIGSEGFSPNNTIPTLAGYALTLAWLAWLLFVAWRTNRPLPV